MTDVLVCIKRVPDTSGQVLLTDDAQGGGRPLRRLHHQQPRELGDRARDPGRQRHRWQRHAAHDRRRRGDRAAAQRAGPGLPVGGAGRGRPDHPRSGRRRGRGRGGGARPRVRGPRLRPGAARQRRRRLRRLPGADPAWPTPSSARSSPARPWWRSPTAQPRRTSTGRTVRRPTACRCPPWWPCWRVARSRATPPSKDGWPPRRWRSRPGRSTREPVGASRQRLLLPPPEPSSVELLGEGPQAAGAVVDLFERLAVLK